MVLHSLRAEGERERRAALDRARRASHVLDEAFRVPVIDYRVGLDPIVSLLPVAGDSAMGVVSLYVVFQAVRAGAPRRVVAVMLALVAIDVTIGSVPILGTVFDAVWKANAWNVALLERHLED
ncbi:MAG: DUF4112 domain-containing protein [Haloarculaceae archaeon]